MTEIISRIAGVASWTPVEGETTQRLGDYLVRSGELPNDAVFESVKHSALDIVSRCKAFDNHPGQRTGLVVGYVQSGKTMSMTAVATLARDNGCRIVIVLAGTTKILLEQSCDRFRSYLRTGGARPGDWTMLDSRKQVYADVDGPLLRNSVAEWQEDIPEDDKKPLFITVMKHHRHLRRLRDFLATANLENVPAVIIDDEADQAGLNTQPDKSEPSTTFRCIRDVRSCLPNHTYVQYTATPQAPLLISLVDMLSPEFSVVITPGPGYTGGTIFFDPVSPYIDNIPFDDLFAAGDPPASPPPSLLNALRIYFVGVAIARLRDSGGPRSMLVHPSQRTEDHGQFVRMIQAIKTRWVQGLSAGPGDPDYPDLIQTFQVAYDEVSATSTDLPPFDDEFIQTLKLYVRRTVIHQVNSEDGSEVDWDNCFSHVLVGGEKLNRGYTVKGLTVTYMPRGAGGWNADTVQQRARFFGYKQSYIGLCRICLHPDVAQAYRDYVIHEEDMRAQLIKHGDKPLSEWKRVFFMDGRLRPTRNNVLSDPFFRSTRLKWFTQSFPHLDDDIIKHNRTITDAFIGLQTFADHSQYPQHSEAEVPLSQIMEHLLVDYKVEGSRDVVALYSVRCWIADVLTLTPNATCTVINMTKGAERNRTEDGTTRRMSLFEGRRSSGNRYPGDTALKDDTAVTIQLHRLHAATAEGVQTANVPALAVWVPNALRREDVLVQPGAEG